MCEREKAEIGDFQSIYESESVDVLDTFLSVSLCVLPQRLSVLSESVTGPQTFTYEAAVILAVYYYCLLFAM